MKTDGDDVRECNKTEQKIVKIQQNNAFNSHRAQLLHKLMQ